MSRGDRSRRGLHPQQSKSLHPQQSKILHSQQSKRLHPQQSKNRNSPERIGASLTELAPAATLNLALFSSECQNRER